MITLPKDGPDLAHIAAPLRSLALLSPTSPSTPPTPAPTTRRTSPPSRAR
jgi:hypothetical protein